MNRITKGIWISAVVTTLLFSSFSSFAQKKKSSGSSSYNWGIGVKLGDPYGVSIKKYTGNKAWEFIIGRSGYYWGDRNDYGKHYFDHKGKYKNNKNYTFLRAYDYGYPLSIQLRHIFFHKDIEGVDGLKWYVGAGAQFRFSSYYIRYEYWDYNGHYHLEDDKVTDIGLGVDGVIGLEYTFEDLPLSIGLDANLYLEIVDRPFYPLGQGGLSIRYNF